MGLAVGVEEGQPVEALVVLGKAAEAQAEGGDALLGEELALLLRACWQPLRECCGFPWGVPSLLSIQLDRCSHWQPEREEGRSQGVCSRLLAALFCAPETFWTFQGLIIFPCMGKEKECLQLEAGPCGGLPQSRSPLSLQDGS